MTAQVFIGARVFDGLQFGPGPLRVADGVVTGPGEGSAVRLDGGLLVPGFLDLQVNGAGGRMVDGTCTADWLAEMCAVHARLGATGILPTLITDTAEATAAVIAAGAEAARRQVPGFLGLHLEGPHLDPRRKGAHDPALIRPMTEDDLTLLLKAARQLPSLMVTLAPSSVTAEQIGRLAAAGVVVSLGHSDCTHGEAQAAIAAGASCVTHLFNAMSQLGNRDPGLVGAALTAPVHAGLIADGIHVAPETIRIAMAASDRLFLVSDAMAAAGSALTEFTLNGRRILRRDGRLTLEDGTLAGADLTLPQAVTVMLRLGTPPEVALAMATSRPAACLRRGDSLGRLLPGRAADMLHLADDGRLLAVWRGGERLA
ncbi:N-acetylglucosamine-6-phosphate deacetylase [Tabrizicola aquatica]|uniref:N-acetylglucosamine-6-phosphate deacetylase n=1 Tax=Tabrizicola aquatica TaxID=909926 RepID=UPI000CD2D51F|nr:N-acetylglucosamine-6-phosphate deacetylase [Tabrizicola aquatica]